MFTIGDIELLCRDDVRQAVEENLGREPAEVALDRRVPFAAAVATQVKYLQRARRKLPSFYAARCIMMPQAFEQASGEECALHKSSRMSGESALDLTCGMGVDAWALSRRFARVVAVERNEVVAAAARENFKRLGAENIEVVCDSAENYVRTHEEHFDWCCVDPDRRSSDGRRLFLPQDCSPDIFSLGILPAAGEEVSAAAGEKDVSPKTLEKGSVDKEESPKTLKKVFVDKEVSPKTIPMVFVDKVIVKNSPMYDVEEAFRAFEGCSVEAVSSGGECKEVLVWCDGEEPRLTATALGTGSFGVACAQRGRGATTREPFRSEVYRWAAIPDAAIVKTRLVQEHLGRCCDVTSGNGCGFAAERPQNIIGKVFEIASLERYDPRKLRQRLKGLRITVLLRDVPLTPARIFRDTGLREGGDRILLFTSAEGHIWVAELNPQNGEQNGEQNGAHYNGKQNKPQNGA